MLSSLTIRESTLAYHKSLHTNSEQDLLWFRITGFRLTSRVGNQAGLLWISGRLHWKTPLWICCRFHWISPLWISCRLHWESPIWISCRLCWEGLLWISYRLPCKGSLQISCRLHWKVHFGLTISCTVKARFRIRVILGNI